MNPESTSFSEARIQLHYAVQVIAAVTNAYAVFKDDNSEYKNESTIGIGFSPGDIALSQPYCYVNIWPHPMKDSLPEIDIGKWITKGWVGAILNLVEKTDVNQLQNFYQNMINVSKPLLKEED